MTVVVVAVLGLLGTLAASSAVNEWLRRRDLREAIKADLDIWAKLPKGSDASNNLMGRIEDRVTQLGAEPPSRRWSRGGTYLISVLMLSAGFVVLWINGGLEWVRGDDGILRLHGPDGSSTRFMTVVLRLALIYIWGSVFLSAMVDSMLRRPRSRHGGMQSVRSIDDGDEPQTGTDGAGAAPHVEHRDDAQGRAH